MTLTRYIALTALTILIFCSGTAMAGDGTCRSIKDFETKVEVNLILANPHYDFSKTKDQINRERDGSMSEWVQRNNMSQIWKADDMSVGGYASGASAYSVSSRTTYRPVDSYWVYYCIYFAKITVDVFYRTQIVIPSETERGTCKFEVVLEHELRHHEANQSAYKEYIDRLDNDIREILAVMEDEYIPKEGVKTHMDNMKQGMKDMLDVYIFKSTEEKMTLLNGQIDSPEEYGSVGQKVKECEERRKAESLKASLQ